MKQGFCGLAGGLGVSRGPYSHYWAAWPSKNSWFTGVRPQHKVVSLGGTGLVEPYMRPAGPYKALYETS